MPDHLLSCVAWWNCCLAEQLLRCFLFCSFGQARKDAEQFLGTFTDIYVLERVSVMGDDARLLKCYPGGWQVGLKDLRSAQGYTAFGVILDGWLPPSACLPRSLSQAVRNGLTLQCPWGPTSSCSCSRSARNSAAAAMRVWPISRLSCM